MHGSVAGRDVSSGGCKTAAMKDAVSAAVRLMGSSFVHSIIQKPCVFFKGQLQ